MDKKERILQNISIVDVAEKYYETIGTGKTVKVRGDDSLTIYPRTNSFNDFSGKISGNNVIDFIIYHENKTFSEALDFLDTWDTEYTKVVRVENNDNYDNKAAWVAKVQAENKARLTPAIALDGIRELYPFINDPLPYMGFLGYTEYRGVKSITFEYPSLSVSRYGINHKGEKGKWIALSGSKRTYIPYHVNEDDKYVFIYSGMAERIAMVGMGVSYIGLQMDSSDKNISSDIIDAVGAKTVVILEENDDSSRKLTERLILKFQSVKVFKPDEDRPKNFDFRDFVNEIGDFKQVKNMMNYFIQRIKEVTPPVQDEIIIPYSTKYPNIKPIKKGVIIARTGSGKTFQFEGKPDTLILVPRVLQTTVYTGESLDFLFNKIAIDGAIVTYDKFYGHYRSSEEFKSAIDHNKITLVVDEAHMLVSRPSRMNKTIYGLDAVFMSGTLEKFFRRDLQRYKYKPSAPEQMYYTNGTLPTVEGSLVFVDNAKALIHNYSSNCIVSKEHKHNNVNIHTTDLPFVFSTSALREGISINNGNFVACMAYMQACQLWSMKDTIQGLHRVRGENILRIVSKEPPKTYDKYIDVDWWMNFVKDSSEDDKAMNALFGEHYSKLIKTTHKVNNYTEPSEYGVICYLSEKTKHNFDKDFYTFSEYVEDYQPLNIDLDTSGVVVEENGMLRYTMSNGVMYEFPEKIRDKFMRWIPQVESGLVGKMMKMKEFKNFKEIYNRSNIGQTIRKNYNKIHKGHGKKYSIDMFYNLIKELVKIEMRSDNTGEKIYNLYSVDMLPEISIKVVGFCPFEEAKIVAENG